MNERMQKALSDQVNAEMYSAYLYLGMAAYFAEKGLRGFENWMKIQALEELYHAMKIFNFIQERGASVTLEAIEKPLADWSSPPAAFEAVLAHEKKVTAMINDLVDTAIQEKEHASNNFLQWFVKEQVEEEASADEIVRKLQLAQDQANGLLMLDKEMAARAFNIPPDVKLLINPQPGQ